MMWWNHSWGSGWGWIPVMVVCMAMMARMMRHGAQGPWGRRVTVMRTRPSAARRLASGEIGVAGFEGHRDALRRASNSTADCRAAAPQPERSTGHVTR